MKKGTVRNFMVVVLIAAAAGIIFFVIPDTPPEIPVPSDSRAQWGLPVMEILGPKSVRIRVEIARSQQEQEIGLMFRDRVPMQTGMLFVYPKEDYHQIWMKNTFIDLDLIWLDAKKRIRSMERHAARMPDETREEDLPV
jgi:uncharacterized membrane protein (UPF0127 family)